MNLVLLKKFNTFAEAEIVKAALEAQGIEARTQSDNVAGLKPELNISSGVSVFVSEHNLESARKFIESR